MKVSNLQRLCLFVVLIPCIACGSSDAASQDWRLFKNIYLSEAGRIIDREQGNISHSEGQGYGLLLALHNDDKLVFDKVWVWTKATLQIRKDHLFVWKWDASDVSGLKRDSNNASDGDILIAYALLQGFEKWGASVYQNEAIDIIKDIRRLLLTEYKNHQLLLPGELGFVHQSDIEFNPSYQIYAAFELFEKYDRDFNWSKLSRSAKRLVKMSAQNQTKLPLDWVVLTAHGVKAKENKFPGFGDEAIRVFLYQCWQEEDAPLFDISLIKKIIDKHGYFPRRISDKGELSDQVAPAGYYAVLALAAYKQQQSQVYEDLRSKATKRFKQEKRNYYSDVLYLLAQSRYPE